jgi:hypothetical protein
MTDPTDERLRREGEEAEHRFLDYRPEQLSEPTEGSEIDRDDEHGQ